MPCSIFQSNVDVKIGESQDGLGFTPYLTLFFKTVDPYLFSIQQISQHFSPIFFYYTLGSYVEQPSVWNTPSPSKNTRSLRWFEARGVIEQQRQKIHNLEVWPWISWVFSPQIIH